MGGAVNSWPCDHISSAHYDFRRRTVSVDGQSLATAPSSEIADAILTNAGYELIGDWLSANLGFARLVAKRAEVVADGKDML
jgi:hypothetical protein